MTFLPPLLGRSPALGRVRDFLDRAAVVDAPVLILGETGTGKSLLARHLHAGSRRAERPMTVVNCAAIPDSLFESELFGHVRGAFTGAHADRDGLVRATQGGTLFLDEMADLPGPQQAKLLTAVEERLVRPVGSSAAVEVDFRLVSATCRPLGVERAHGRFREDLYHRIALLSVTLPPLRDRVPDILPLARRFLDAAVRRHGLDERRLSPALRPLLESHPWPGNVRQLAHTVEAAAILSLGSELTVDLVLPLLEREARGVESPQATG